LGLDGASLIVTCWQAACLRRNQKKDGTKIEQEYLMSNVCEEVQFHHFAVTSGLTLKLAFIVIHQNLMYQLEVPFEF
jgi:hypothetical protein